MSENTTGDVAAAEADPEAVAEAETVEETPALEQQEPESAPEPEPKAPNAEAGKYRTRLRAAEATIADHEAHIAELQDVVVRGLLRDRLGDPAVFAKLVDRSEWSGDDGRIDLDKLDAAVAHLLQEHPALEKRLPVPRTKPQMAKGEPVREPGTPRKLSAVDVAFGNSGARWSDVIGKGERAADAGLEAKVGKARIEVSRTPDL
ncbi:hypothetical protein ACOKGD_13925 [Microbacterium phosphatis]|uniref:hypothetical protein n=1 Tax=Microbacterium phosphatis TaxID=3140248 RepID=UPI00314099A9